MKVIVVGGGPAGMCAAISAKKSGYDVILLENSNNKTLQTISIPAQTKFKYELNLSEVDPELYILIENK